mmetsp:Transcript_8417/g.18358  ORF Transcript_8417/g.18358 Transcript_8417/m.18358 type:complete len:242 (+) Transcript_8417:526-1251(+)
MPSSHSFSVSPSARVMDGEPNIFSMESSSLPAALPINGASSSDSPPDLLRKATPRAASPAPAKAIPALCAAVAATSSPAPVKPRMPPRVCRVGAAMLSNVPDAADALRPSASSASICCMSAPARASPARCSTKASPSGDMDVRRRASCGPRDLARARAERFRVTSLTSAILRGGVPQAPAMAQSSDRAVSRSPAARTMLEMRLSSPLRKKEMSAGCGSRSASSGSQLNSPDVSSIAQHLAK